MNSKLHKHDGRNILNYKKKLQNECFEDIQRTEEAFMRIFEKLTYRNNKWSVWSDFITTFACCIQGEKRNEMFCEILDKYAGEEQELICELMAKTYVTLINNSKQDFLGNMFMLLKLGNVANGQFFTPYNIGEFMANINIDSDNVKQTIKKQGYFLISDPTCGSGALLIAAVHRINDVLKNTEYNIKKHLVVVGQDIDYIVAMMCYIQLSILGVSGYVKVGNALLEPISEKDSLDNYWFTSEYIKNNFMRSNK